MHVGVLGGGLQGLEAAYLLQKSGHRVVMLDRRPRAPAFGLADERFCFDVVDCTQSELFTFLQKVDVIIPATENRRALAAMADAAAAAGIVFCYDAKAFQVSSNKLLSNQLFERLGLPYPRPWPFCDYPLFVKPACGSGSEGVQVVSRESELAEILSRQAQFQGGLVIEEFVSGPSYSVEVVAVEGEGIAFATTKLNFDERYDCNRVLAPCDLNDGDTEKMRTMALKIAAALNLTGVMDLETIYTDRQFKLLEIDARLPSQTPTVVLHATGANIIDYLLSAFLQKKLKIPLAESNKAVIYEHLYFNGSCLSSPGEHAISESTDLFFHTEDFFGADEAITNYSNGNPWLATVILTGESGEEVWLKRRALLQNILAEHGVAEGVRIWPSVSAYSPVGA